jgi:regulator of ribonuclease activity A
MSLTLTSPVADLCDAHPGRVRVLSGPFRFFTGETRFVGPARLVALHAADAALAALLAAPGHGAVAMVGVAVGERCAVFGDGMARAAETNGWAGVVIDGALRDVALIRDRTVGVAARAVAPVIARDGPAGGEAGLLHAAGCVLRAGDWIAADEDGIVALDAELAAALRP